MKKRLIRCVSAMLAIGILWTSLPVQALELETGDADAPAQSPAIETSAPTTSAPTTSAPEPNEATDTPGSTPDGVDPTPTTIVTDNPETTPELVDPTPTVTVTTDPETIPELVDPTHTAIVTANPETTPEAIDPTPTTTVTANSETTPELVDPTPTITVTVDPETTPEAVDSIPTIIVTTDPETTPEVIDTTPTTTVTANPETTPEAVDPTPTAIVTDNTETTPEVVDPTPTISVTDDPETTPEAVDPTPTTTVTDDPETTPELVDPTPTATVTATPETTPSPTPEAARIVAFDLSELPEGVAVPYGTEEAALGLPEALTAHFSDGTSAPVAVVWVCVGGAAYHSMPEDPAATFTFQAALAQDIPCDAEMPVMGVAFMPMLMMMAADELAAFGLSGDGEYTINGTEITLTSGTFSVDSASAEAITIVVNGATLTANASVNGDVKVSSGHADLKGANALTVDSSATVTGTVSTINLSANAKLEAESATIGRIETPFSSSCEVVIRDSTVDTLILKNYKGSTHVSGSTVTNLSFSYSFVAAAADMFWPKQGGQDRLPAAGEVASEMRMEFDELNIPKRHLIFKAPFTLTFTPNKDSLVDGRYPEAGRHIDIYVRLYDQNGKDVCPGTSVTTNPATANYTAPLTLTGGSVTKVYDGTPDFKNGVVKHATWTKENWDGTVVDYTGEIGDVTVPDFAVAGKDVGTYTYTPETLTFPTAPAGTAFAATMPTLTAEITKAPVTLSGTFGRFYFPTSLEAVANQISAVGLMEGETLADLGIAKLTDDAGRDLLDNVYDDMGKTLDVTKVECDPNANYEVTLQNLRMIVYYLTLYGVTMPDACIGLGAPAFPEPELTLDTSLPLPKDRSVKYEYAEEGTENWSETPPTTEGNYQIRVTFGKYGDYFTEEVGTDSFKVEKTEWGGKAIYPVETPYGETFKVQLQLFDYNDGILPYQQYGYIEVDFEGETYRGDYDAAATDGCPFTATIPTEGKTTQIGSAQVLPVRFYLPKIPGGDDYELVFTREAYVTVVKKDLSPNLTVTGRKDGTYWGINVNSSDAMIKVAYSGSPSLKLTQTDIFEVSITRNGAEHEPLKLELLTYTDEFRLMPKQAGEYELTVRVKEDNPFYTGSCTATCSVAKQKLVVHAKDATMERGTESYNFGYTVKQGSLATGDTLTFSHTLGDLKGLPVGEFPFSMDNIKVWYKNANSGLSLDVTDSYEISQIDTATHNKHLANMTVTPKAGNFTIVIPPTASVNDGSMALDCTAIDAGMIVGVTVQSANNFALTCSESGERLAYELSRDGAKLSDGDAAATFTAAGSQQLTLNLADGVSANIPGVYSDTLTFTARTE